MDPTPNPGEPTNRDEPGHELPAYSARPETGAKSGFTKRQLPHSVTAFIVAVGYSTLVLFSWIVIAISTQKPLNLDGYRYQDFDRIPFIAQDDLASSKRLYDAAQVVGSVADMITLPVISTVVAAVIAARLQLDNKRRYTLRQIMTLADKSWNSPLSLLAAITRPGAHFSSYLWLGIVLTWIGFVIPPLRTGLLTSELVKVPYRTISRDIIVNDPANFMLSRDDNGIGYAQQVTANLRSTLAHTEYGELQPRLWRNRNTTMCDIPALAAGQRTGSSSDCLEEQIALSALTHWFGADEYFVSPLPYKYSTGAILQYAPRMESVVTFSESTLPAECNADADNPFYVSYTANDTEESEWTATACILEDTRDIIQPTRDRQTFRETAYFAFDDAEINDDMKVLEITVETSIGLFELPNAANYEEPGLLLDSEPSNDGRGPCQTRSCSRSSSSRRRDISRTQGPNQLAFQDSENKGPLSYFITALFGHGSYVHMLNSSSTIPRLEHSNGTTVRTTIGRRPLAGLTRSSGTRCGKYVSDVDLEQGSAAEMRCLAGLFFDGTDDTEQMLRSAIFLASQAILLKPSDFTAEEFNIGRDPGLDYLRPKMSKVGLVVLSLLHAILVASLLGLSFYAATCRSWAPSLNALTMMRIGNEIGGEKLPFVVSKTKSDVRELDDLSIQVGNKAGADAPIGIVSALGGTKLNGRKDYLAYKARASGSHPAQADLQRRNRPGPEPTLPSYRQAESQQA